ncbi:hypothetical protein OAJ27_00835 [bacterium]|nr:hypothetical protein [bacterium]
MTNHTESLFLRQVKVGIEHRFRGEPFKKKGVFGQKQGASVGFSASAGLGKQQVITLKTSNLYDQTHIKYKISRQFKPKHYVGVTAAYDQFKLSTKEEQTVSGGIFYGFQEEEKGDIALDITYKDYFSDMQTGIGLSWYLSSKLSVFYEGKTAIAAYKKNPIHMAGFKVMTFGHNFYVYTSNQTDVGAILGESGTDEETFYMGFLLERVFDF